MASKKTAKQRVAQLRANGKLGGRPREMTDAVRLVVMVPADLAARIDASAERDGVTRSRATRDAIARGLSP